MTQEMLSALLDGECSAEELDLLLAQMDRDPSLKARYTRTIAAREARDTRIRAFDPDFASRVTAALARESAPARILSFPVLSRTGRGHWRHAAGLALAAGLGAIAVLVMRPDSAGIPAPATVAAVNPGTPASSAEPVTVGHKTWNQLDPGDAERLNAYLIAYSQSRAQQGMGSTLGYARFAAHTAENRPQRIEGPSARTTELRDSGH